MRLKLERLPTIEVELLTIFGAGQAFSLRGAEGRDDFIGSCGRDGFTGVAFEWII
jgi:hypothetical protein